MKESSSIITCSQCGYQSQAEHLKRNCSNCFSCTGCERYSCPQCHEEIIIQEVQALYSKK